jgi:hypothetical protein
MRREGNILQDHHFIIAVGFVKGPAQKLIRIFGITGEVLLVGPNHTVGGSQQTGTGRIVAGPPEQSTDCFLSLFPAGPLNRAGLGFIISHWSFLSKNEDRRIAGHSLVVLGRNRFLEWL